MANSDKKPVIKKKPAPATDTRNLLQKGEDAVTKLLKDSKASKDAIWQGQGGKGGKGGNGK